VLNHPEMDPGWSSQRGWISTLYLWGGWQPLDLVQPAHCTLGSHVTRLPHTPRTLGTSRMVTDEEISAAFTPEFADMPVMALHRGDRGDDGVGDGEDGGGGRRGGQLQERRLEG